MEGRKAEIVDVSIFKGYNWGCPRCKAFNKRITNFNVDEILACPYCGTQVKCFAGTVTINDLFLRRNNEDKRN